MINFISFLAILTTQKYQFCRKSGHGVGKTKTRNSSPKVLIVLAMVSVFNHDEDKITQIADDQMCLISGFTPSFGRKMVLG